MSVKKYKSPLLKLVKFFESSRDNWKLKCKEAKFKIKLLKNRILFLESSKAKIKKAFKEYKQQVLELEAEVALLNAEVFTDSKAKKKLNQKQQI